MAKNYFVSEFNGKKTVHTFPDDVPMSDFFRNVTKAIAYSDCTEEDITEIVFQDESFEYLGWQPGMVYQYNGCAGSSWEGCFPEWDH